MSEFFERVTKAARELGFEGLEYQEDKHTDDFGRQLKPQLTFTATYRGRTLHFHPPAVAAIDAMRDVVRQADAAYGGVLRHEPGVLAHFQEPAAPYRIDWWNQAPAIPEPVQPSERFCLYRLNGTGDMYLVPLAKRPEFEAIDTGIEMGFGAPAIPDWAKPWTGDLENLTFRDPKKL